MFTKHDTAVEILMETVQGILAVLAFGALGAVYIIELLRGQPFAEPPTLSALAGMIAAFFFSNRGMRQTGQIVDQVTRTLSAAPGNGKTTPEPPPTAGVQQ